MCCGRGDFGLPPVHFLLPRAVVLHISYYMSQRSSWHLLHDNLSGLGIRVDMLADSRQTLDLMIVQFSALVLLDNMAWVGLTVPVV